MLLPILMLSPILSLMLLPIHNTHININLLIHQDDSTRAPVHPPTISSNSGTYGGTARCTDTNCKYSRAETDHDGE